MVVDKYSIDGVQISVHDDFLPKTKEEKQKRFNELDELINKIIKNMEIRKMNSSS